MIDKVTDTLIRSLMNHIGPSIVQVLQAPTTDARGMFAVVLSILVNTLCFSISQQQWAAMMHASCEPCGKPGCDCEIIHAQLFEALNALRDDTIKKFRTANPAFKLPGE